MPTTRYGYVDRSAQFREAERQVRAKFPTLIEGSSGWHRAVDNHMRRMRGRL